MLTELMTIVPFMHGTAADILWDHQKAYCEHVTTPILTLNSKPNLRYNPNPMTCGVCRDEFIGFHQRWRTFRRLDFSGY